MLFLPSLLILQHCGGQFKWQLEKQSLGQGGVSAPSKLLRPIPCRELEQQSAGQELRHVL